MVSALDTAAPEIVDTVQPDAVSQDIAPETPVEAVAETEQSQPTETVSEIDEDTLARLIKEKGLEDRIRESERQKTESRLKREAGSRESTREAVANIIRAIGGDPDSNVDGATVKRAEYLYELARAHSATELAKELPEAVLAEYKVPVEYRERAVEALETQGKTAYVRTLLEGAVAAQKGTLSLKDIPEDSTLRKEVDALVAEKLKSELKAARVENAPAPIDAPTPPRGPAVGGAERFANMTPVEAARLGPEDWDAYKKSLLGG